MLSFTAAGAVATPTVVQVRVTRSFPDRVSAGAPIPTRSLSVEELRANLRHFVVDMAGPRSRACDALVLSGLALERLDGLVELLAEARTWGLQRITVHAGADDAPSLASGLGAQINDAAVTVRSREQAEQLAAWQPANLRVTAVVPLVDEVIERTSAVAAALIRARPERVVLTWPFPPADAPPPAHRAAEAVPKILAQLDEHGIAAGVKGLPACRLGGASRIWRSQNRWYVDAEHQCGDALLFFPRVVRFAKEDACRYCSVEARCDGAPEAWLRAGLVGQLSPLDSD
ncbi:MAG: hypothetical protein KC912_00465 [Proteobacteria bacterium]|nr:hypothetical protein [Pseudomonadota bacterium]